MHVVLYFLTNNKTPRHSYKKKSPALHTNPSEQCARIMKS